MDNVKKKILEKSNSYNYYKDKYWNLDDKINDNSKQITDLNEKFSEFQEKMLNEFNEINLENKKVNAFNQSLLNEFNSAVDEKESLIIELNTLKKENDELINHLDLIIKDNEELKSNFIKNNEILDSYNENFKVLFYFFELKPKGILKNIQNLCQELLTFISNICKKHNIEYWIERGTHLGAVLRGGFLPWDDDIDLGMMRKDYDKFFKVFKVELKNYGLERNIKFRRLKHGKNVLYFIQISCGGIALLNIMPYDYIKNPQDNIEELYDKEKTIFKSNILDGKNYSKAIKELYNNLKLSHDPQPFVIPGVERPRSSTFHVQKSSELFPLKQIFFNGTKYSCLKNDDYHLKKLYGDWKDLPKVLDRSSRIYLFMDRPNRVNRIKEDFELLTIINRSFAE